MFRQAKHASDSCGGPVPIECFPINRVVYYELIMKLGETMAKESARIGIGVITCNRLPYLQQLVCQVRTCATLPYDLVVADDGSVDGTVAWARSEGLSVVTGPRRGVAWNKNRALLFLAMYSECDVMLLLEDDMWPVQPGWDDIWLRAALAWDHVNYAEPAYADQPELGALGQGTPDSPLQALVYGGQCTATSRHALATVGYLDTRFNGYGHGHAEWSSRYQSQFEDKWSFPDERIPCLNIGLGEAWTTTRAFNPADAARNLAVHAHLTEERGLPRFTPPWCNRAEREALLGEIVTGHETQNGDQSHQSQVSPERHEATPDYPVSFDLFTEQLIAFRHYLHAIFHLRPLVPVHSAHLSICGARTELTPSYAKDHVVLEGYSLIESISGVEEAQLHICTALGDVICGDLVAKDLHRVDAFNQTLAAFVDHVKSHHLDILEIGSRQRRATAFDPAFRETARSYTGIDILEGPNVDIACDAHQLSRHVGASRFDVVYSQYVFEHLAMPWVVISEINRVLRVGGECFVATNQSIGLHDLPWDFWRYSESAWHTLFNEDTGFELQSCGLGEPVHITPRRYHAGFRDHEGGVGYQASFAWARKVRNVTLEWPVSPGRIFAKLSREYPREITD